MAFEPINERVAALEPQVEALHSAMSELLVFKFNMIQQIADLTATVKTLSWKVSLITGGAIVALNQLLPWLAKKFLP